MLPQAYSFYALKLLARVSKKTNKHIKISGGERLWWHIPLPVFYCPIFKFPISCKPNTNAQQGAQPLFRPLIPLNFTSTCWRFCPAGEEEKRKTLRTCGSLKEGHICQIEIREFYQLVGVLGQIEQVASLWLCRISIAVWNKALIGILPWTGSVNTTAEYDPRILGNVCLFFFVFLETKWFRTKHRLHISEH